MADDSGGVVALRPQGGALIEPERIVVSKADLSSALAKARDEAKKAERQRGEAALKAVKAAHEAELERARDAEMAERARLFAEREDAVLHRIRGARLWAALVAVLTTALVSVLATWGVAKAVLLNGVDVGLDAMGRSQILQDTLKRDEPDELRDFEGPDSGYAPGDPYERGGRFKGREPADAPR